MKYVLAVNSGIAKGIVVFGMVGEKCISTAFNIGELEELTDNYIKEHYEQLLNDVYQKGYEDGRNVSEMQTQNNMFNEGVEYGKTQEQNRVWEYAKKIAVNPDDGGLSPQKLDEVFGYKTVQNVFKNYTVQQAIEKIEAYEEKQKADAKIKVKDEVIWTVDESVVIIVTRIYIINNLEWCDGFSKDGKVYSILTENARKTGRQFDIDSILEAMNG